MSDEKEHSIFGVEGRMFARHVRDAERGTFSNQTWKTSQEFGAGSQRLVVEIRFDDCCGNGHNSFAVTATEYEYGSGRWRTVAGGCIHDDIARVFPQLAPLIKWHLCSTEGPMHYVANTIYLAGDRDHNGLRKGETCQIKNGKTGQLAWKLSKHGLKKYVDSDTRPPETVTLQYEPWLRVGEGKERELDAARSVAVWPEATDAQLSAPPEELRAVLEARLPALLAAFRADIEAIGFAWSSAEGC